MRSFLLIPSLLSLVTGTAQLVNGSFEQAGAPSLEGWEWTCEDPGQPNTAAPGSGSWCMTKLPGHAKGCFPNYAYQRLPGLLNGQLLSLSGWVRCSDEVVCLGGYIGLGTLSNGMIIADDLAGSMDPAWTFISITDTVEMQAGDTTVVLLSSGFIGGPISPDAGYFDGITLELNTGLTDHQNADVASYFDAMANVLFLSSGNSPLRTVALFDLTGRTLPYRSERINARSFRIDLSAMPTGIYFAAANTDLGAKTIRFLVP